MSSTGTSDLVGTLLAERYLIVAPIGSGASARVFLADDSVLKRRVALKVLLETMSDDERFLRRFTAEARAAAALNHPNVMHVYDSGTTTLPNGSTIPYLVLEFVGGGSLRALLDQGPLLSPSQALSIGLDAARGLDYAHRNGLVHRDIKPANLLFGEEGRLRIADFGLARALAEASWTEPLGVALGTPRYFSPEQAMGKLVDGRSDVYSLALVLVEAVTGVVPFSADNRAATILARCERDLEVGAELGHLAAVLEWAGRRDPELRPDAGELEIAFLAAAEEMDRPRPLRLPGAIPLEVLDARAAGVRPDLVAADEVDSDSATVLDNVSTPSSTDEVPAPDADGSDVSEGAPRRRRWRVVVAAMAALMLLGGGSAYWWYTIRIPVHALPRVVGVDVATARARLQKIGMIVDTSLLRRDGTTPDEVVSQDPAAGTSLGEGSHVRLAVSLGNTLVALPALTAEMDEATATAAITAAGLTVGARSEVHDEKIPAGHLVASSAAVDATGTLAKGSTVDVVYSSGPTPRTVPADLTGQSLEAVNAALKAVQLGVDAQKVYDETIPEGIVISLNHAAGEELPRDTVIQVMVSKGPAPIVIPDVKGKPGVEAERILVAAGFTVSGTIGRSTAAVQATVPPIGQAQPRGTAIQIVTQ